MRTLVVEDEQTTAKLLKHSLEKNAYVVDVAENGLQAYQRTQLSDYDFIIMAAKSPQIDGLELCRRLRHEGKQSHILIITAFNNAADRVSGLNVGADDCMSKPFAFPELLARLRALSRRRFSERVV